MPNSLNPSWPDFSADCAAHLALLTQLGAETFRGMQQLIDLNLADPHAAPEQRRLATPRWMAGQNAEEWRAGNAAAAPADSQRQRLEMIERIHTEFARCVEQRMAEIECTLNAVLDRAIATAPAEAGAEIALLQQALQSVQTGYERFREAIEKA